MRAGLDESTVSAQSKKANRFVIFDLKRGGVISSTFFYTHPPPPPAQSGFQGSGGGGGPNELVVLHRVQFWAMRLMIRSSKWSAFEQAGFPEQPGVL